MVTDQQPTFKSIEYSIEDCQVVAVFICTPEQDSNLNTTEGCYLVQLFVTPPSKKKSTEDRFVDLIQEMMSILH